MSVSSSGVYVVGSTEGELGTEPLPTFDFDAYVRKYDSSGNYQWTQQFGTIDREEAFGAMADDTGVYVVGYTRSTFPGLTSSGGEDAFLARYDVNGSQQWISQIGTTDDDYGYGVSADATGIYVGGYTDSNTIPDDLRNGDPSC